MWLLVITLIPVYNQKKHERQERNEKYSLKLVEPQRINVGSKACVDGDQERPEVKCNEMGTVLKLTHHQAACLRVSNL